MLNLNDREWKLFAVNDLFEIKSGKDVNLNQNYGGIPYVNSSGVNNGVTCFVKNYKIIVSNCITIARTGTVGATFYQKGKVAISGNIRALFLKNKTLNTHLAQFLICTLKTSIGGNYNYGKILGTERISKLSIFLPTMADGTPDYAFMEQYIKEREWQLIQKYKDYISNNAQTGGGTLTLENREWKAFTLSDIFTISSGKRLTTADMDEGNLAFIGATEMNNGITNWVHTSNETLDRNVLGVNYNGSVAESFYHSYNCIFSDDVKRLHLKDHKDGKYVLLFCSLMIKRQKSKYTYGYKFNANRMTKQKILLPTTPNGTPDYAFMESYAKMIMLQKYRQYLNYINA